MSVKFSNNATTALAASIGASDTTITVLDASKLPILALGDYTYITIDTDTASPTLEILKVTGISGNTLTVVRGQDGTTASSFAAGTKVELRLTAALLNDIAVVDPSGEPIGFQDKNESTISFNSSTRTFTIAPVSASFTVWCKGVKYEFTTPQTVVIPNTTGLHYLYFNAYGVLSTQMSYFTWEEHAPTAYIYWNATTSTAIYFGDERHGVTLDWQTHEYLHRTRGAAIASGFGASGYTTTGTGATDADAQIDIGGGTFFDEDMQIDVVSTNSPAANTWQQDLSGPARIPVLYLSGSAWVIDAPTNFPFKVVSGVPQYNLYSGGTWSTANVANNEYHVSWILATNNLNYPVVSIISQAATNQVSQAEAMTFEGLSLSGFPSVEFRPLYKVIYQHKTSFANSVKVSTIAVYDLRSLQSAGVAAALVQDHGNLSGLGDDDHAQYLHVSEVRTPSSAVKNSFLPSQGSNSGKYLSTDGSNPSWVAIPSGSLDFTGDVTGSGNTGSSVSLTLAASGVVAGQYTKVTVDAKGRVTAGASLANADVTAALGFTPYNSTNPAGYITSSALSSYLPLSGGTLTGILNGRSPTVSTAITSVTADQAAFRAGASDSSVGSSAGFIPALGQTSVYSSGYRSHMVVGSYRTASGWGGGPFVAWGGNDNNATEYWLFNTGGTLTYSGGKTFLDSSNYSSYALPLSGGTLTGSATLSGNGTGLYFTGGNNRIYFGGGYRAMEGNSNGTQLQIGEGYSGTYLQSPNIYATTSNHAVLHAGNYSSYALPLSGGTLTGVLTSSVAPAAINTTTPGLTNYGFVFNGASSPDNAQAITWTWSNGGSAQAGIYVQSSGGYGTKMYLATTDSFATGAKTAISIDHSGNTNIVRGALTQGGNQVLHAGNYSSYLNNTYVRSIGYATSSNDWNSLGNTYPNSVEQVDPSNFNSTANGPTAASYTYGTLLNFSSQSSSQAQIYISHAGNDLIFRGGWNGASWQTWNRVLTNQNYTSYSPSLTGSGASGTWGINVTGSAGSASSATSANVLVSSDTRTISPSSHSAGRITTGFTSWNNNSGGPYADFIHLRSYTYASGGDDNLVMFRKEGIGMRIWQRGFGSGTAYSSYVDVLHSSNYSSYALPLSGGTLTNNLTISPTDSRSNRFVSVYRGSLGADSAGLIVGTGSTANWFVGHPYSGGGVFNALVISERELIYDGGGSLAKMPLMFFTPGSGNAAGNIGIGKMNPTERLDVDGTIAATGRVVVGNGQTSSWLEMRDTDEGTRYLHNNSSTIGFVANDQNWSFRVNDSGDAYFRNYGWLSNILPAKADSWYHSNRDFGSGTLIQTNINYAVTYGDPFILEIRGNSYGDSVPYDIQYQGYIYSDTIINHGGYSNGTYISGLVAINYNGNLCFWFPRQSYWNGFYVRVYVPYATYPNNRVTSITDSGKPTTAKEVNLSANIRQSLHSANFNTYAPTLTGSGASGTWGISITGNAASVSGISAGQFFNNMGNNHSTYQDFNSVPGFGAYYVQQGGNSPTGTGSHQWYGFTLGLGNDYALSSYATQFYWPRRAQNSDTYIYVRDREGGSWTSWNKIKAGYADNSGQLNGYSSAENGASVVLRTASNGYLYVKNWIDVASAGLFSTTTNGSHWRPSSQTFGSWEISGSKNGYSGIACNGSSHILNWMVGMDGNLQGFYNQSYGWQMYWSGGTLTVFKNSYGGGTGAAVLDSSNYTSYSPSLTGSGASGSWSITAARATRANGNFYIDDNYGNGVVGVYASTRYQGVFAMGDSYKLPADGTSTGSLYGMAWSHPNAGGAAGNLDSHGMLVLINGGFGSCMSYSIKASGNVTAYSDERLKTNWRPMPESFVERLAAVKVGIYDRTDGERITQVGVSAQSLQAVLPEAITKAGDEMGTLSVSYGNAAMASAVELAKELVQLKRELAELKSKLH